MGYVKNTGEKKQSEKQGYRKEKTFKKNVMQPLAFTKELTGKSREKHDKVVK